MPPRRPPPSHTSCATASSRGSSSPACGPSRGCSVRRATGRTSRPPRSPTVLSLVIPAYNEALRLPATLRRVHEYLDETGEEYEVIVVDDGSTDDTVAAVRTF